MPIDSTVKYFHYAMPGAPTLTGTAGTLIALLDACLVNGWGSAGVDSIVISGGIATVTKSAGHPFEVGSVAQIAGATVTGGVINGDQKVLTVPSASTYTFDATGIANQTATGSITHKVAPLGFTKAFSGTNLAAYKSADVTASGFFLRVEDTEGRLGWVRGYESMTDVNTGSNPFPNTTQHAGAGLVWCKSNELSSNSRPWALIGDSKYFYLILAFVNTPAYSAHAAFGDIVKASSTDAFAVHINGSTNASFTVGGSSDEIDGRSWSGSACSMYARSYSGFGNPIPAVCSYPKFFENVGSQRSGASGFGFDNIGFPNLSDGGLYVAPIYGCEYSTPVVYRGVHPGFYCYPQTVGSTTFPNRTKLTAINSLPGRTLVNFNSNSGAFAMDITGPWR